MSVPLVGAKNLRSCIRLAFQANVATLGSTLLGSQPGASFINSGLLLIPAWISNHMLTKVWHEITYQFPNFNGSSKPIAHFILDVITYLDIGHFFLLKKKKINVAFIGCRINMCKRYLTPVLLKIIRSNSEIEERWPIQRKIMHISWQLCCIGMCKISLKSDKYKWRYK